MFNKHLFLIWMLLTGLGLYSQEEGSHYYLVDINSLDDYGIDTMSNIPLGIPVGASVKNFTRTDQNGNRFDLYDQLEEKPMVIIFYRGHWCGICNKHLQSLENSLADLKSKDVNIVAITPESKEYIMKTVDNTGASFPIISDEGGQILKMFDVSFNISESYLKKLGDRALGQPSSTDPILPVPATFIIDQNKKVILSHFDPNYRNRFSVEELFSFLEQYQH